ncbi:MAG: helix-turn-helix transcriptional regulator [Ruminococcaceae bacterium]|nr:helix-turn-helix transcriptional regulator [Oscillospiraceae bacterium]
MIENLKKLSSCRVCPLFDDVFRKRFSMIKENKKKQIDEQLVLQCCMLKTLIIFENNYVVSSLEKTEFKSLVDYVIGNLDKQIKLEDLYKKFFINTQAIEKMFNKYLNTTYKQYVKEQRFVLSKRALLFTDMSVKEIASKVGYSSTQSFSKFFKNMSGTTPLSFRYAIIDNEDGSERTL